MCRGWRDEATNEHNAPEERARWPLCVNEREADRLRLPPWEGEGRLQDAFSMQLPADFSQPGACSIMCGEFGQMPTAVEPMHSLWMHARAQGLST